MFVFKYMVATIWSPDMPQKPLAMPVREPIPVVRRTVTRGVPSVVYFPTYFTKDSRGNKIPLHTIFEEYEEEDEDCEDWDFIEDYPRRSVPIPVPRKKS